MSTQRKRTALGLEKLEQRDVPATGISLLPGGILRIEGSAQNDYVRITEIDTKGNFQVQFQAADGWQVDKEFKASSISRIQYTGKKGDDVLLNRSGISAAVEKITGNTVSLTMDPASINAVAPAKTKGYYVVDPYGKIQVDYLYRGAGYEGQLGVFSTKGMEKMVVGSPEFVKEAMKRVVSNSVMGYVTIDATTQGAKYSGTTPWEGNFNTRAYTGSHSFSMTPGDTVAFVIMPSGKFSSTVNNPVTSGTSASRPLFSIPEANTGATGTDRFDQMFDLDGNRDVFSFEDLSLGGSSDKDFNDMVFQVLGANGFSALGPEVVNASRNFPATNLGKSITAGTTKSLLEYTQSAAAVHYGNGVFVADANGKLSVDFLADNGGYTSKVGMFSLQGMETLDPASPAFRKEAMRRALSDSLWGHIVIDDQAEGARFQGKLEFDGNYNSGQYNGVKTFNVRPGDSFAMMILPNGSSWNQYLQGDLEGTKRPLFSIAAANPVDPKSGKGGVQLADITGNGSVFGFEDGRTDLSSPSDRDYNDIVFRLIGVTLAQAESIANVVNPSKDIRKSAYYSAIVA